MKGSHIFWLSVLLITLCSSIFSIVIGWNEFSIEDKVLILSISAIVWAVWEVIVGNQCTDEMGNSLPEYWFHPSPIGFLYFLLKRFNKLLDKIIGV